MEKIIEVQGRNTYLKKCFVFLMKAFQCSKHEMILFVTFIETCKENNHTKLEVNIATQYVSQYVHVLLFSP